MLISKNEIPRINVIGINVDLFTIGTLNETIFKICKTSGKVIISNVNINAMNIAYEQPWFKKFINDSEYVFCDGHGVMLGAKLIGKNVPEKITYAHWFPIFCKFCEDNKFTLYFLGGEPGIAEKARDNLIKKYPNLKIVGVDHGYFNKDKNSSENNSVIDRINTLKPNILLTSFGMPLQEKWLSENWSEINANIALTGGAALDYMAGKSTRPPQWLTDIGFEWLGRMLYEPRRLWKRYVVGNPLFYARLIYYQITHK